MEFGNNGEYTDKHDGVFYYGGGHMQQHAILNGLGGRDAAGLTREVRSKIGRDVSFFFDLPEVAGGVATSPGEYAKFLRKILRGELRISRMLGSYAVCGSPRACPLQAERTAAPRDEAWHYSLGHWVEDDPDEGDGAFSSLGLFGFYPWIDESMTYYGIVASEGLMEVPSALDCGRVIRAAWMTLPAR
jgi:CubicO group peptidase (beta-lactamase class C family)